VELICDYANLYGCDIGDDLTKFLDFEFELGESRASEAFIDPVSDGNYPHGRTPWGRRKYG
jgi:hypothetical protein